MLEVQGPIAISRDTNGTVLNHCSSSSSFPDQGVRDRFNRKPKLFWTTTPINVSSAAHYLPEATLNSPTITRLLFPCFFSKKQRRSCHTIVRHEHINRDHPLAL
jgi:hypothetical protein